MRSIFHDLDATQSLSGRDWLPNFASALIHLRDASPDFHAPLWVLVATVSFALVLGWLYDSTAAGVRRAPHATDLRPYNKRQP